jgi:SAM-dependent methyltransferase
MGESPDVAGVGGERAANCLLCGGEIYRWSGKAGRHGGVYFYDRCRKCDFVFVNPRPTFQWLCRYYSENAGTGRAAETPAAPDAGQRRAIGTLLTFRPGPGRFLDVGAGSGGLAHAAKIAGLEVTALEVDPRDARGLEAIGGMRVAPMTFEEFEESPGAFDYILMSHVLEHAHDPRAWIEKASGLLRAGGILLLMLPHFNSVYRILAGTRDPYFFPPEHLNHFNRRSLGRKCADCGLAEAGWRTETMFPPDVITRRVAMPGFARGPVRRLAAAASAAANMLTSAAGCGHVLIAHYRKA